MTQPTTQVIQIRIYWLLVGIAVMLGSPVLSIFASAQINERTMEASQRAQEATRAEATLRYCRLLGSQVDVYSEATSPVGKDAYATWLAEYKLQGCKPER